jgi:hypothetical protein
MVSKKVFKSHVKKGNFSRYLIKLSGAGAGAEIRLCGSMEPEPERNKYFRPPQYCCQGRQVNERPCCQRSVKQASMQWGERAVNSPAESGQAGRKVWTGRTRSWQYSRPAVRWTERHGPTRD